MSAAYANTSQVFKLLDHPLSDYAGDKSTCAHSDVPKKCKVMFSKFRVEDWKSFNKYASKVLTGENERALTRTQSSKTKMYPFIVEDSERPMSEQELLSRLFITILLPTNTLRGHREKWRTQGRTTSVFDYRYPDFVLGGAGSAGSSSSQQSDNPGIPVVAGELKRPCLDLGSGLSAEYVTNLIRHKDFHRLNKAKPFFQIFSYLLYTKKGVGILTNLDQARFFKINQEKKILLMSPLVCINQRLDERRHIPHVMQAYIYSHELPDPTADELSSTTTETMLKEAEKEAKELMKRLEEEEKKAKEEAAKKEAAKKEAKSKSSDKKTPGAGPSSGKGGKKPKHSGYEIFSPASYILEKCKVIGTVGEGVTGYVTECDYEGLKVAVKAGFPFDFRDERDFFSHVENEVNIYEKLKGLQGSVVPRVLAGCIERFYTPSAMVLIMEKVGKGPKMKDEKLYVGEKELSREDLLVIREKGVEGLRKIHECGVVHLDTEVHNICVEMREGKVERVWWVDFGDAAEIDREAGMVWDTSGMGINLTERQAIDMDIDEFVRNVGGFLMDFESTS